MLRIRYLAACAVLIAAAASAMAADDQNTAEEREQGLIAVLRSDAAPQDKAITCKRLAIYGSKDAVPALAELLSDEKLAAWARIALEVIPGREADDALREATGRLQGRLLVGVINSIGMRRDAKAVGILIERLKGADAEAASAAAVALGRIGGAPATSALEQSLATAPAAVRSAVAEGCILCAERFLAEDKPAEAVKLYDAVRKAEVPKQRILEATRGAILARQSAGVPLLVEQLRSADKSRFAIGLRTARELPGREVADALVAELGRATAHRQTMLILALADRGDVTALGAVLQAAKSGPKELQVVVIRVMERLGDASCVPLLLDAAMKPDEELSQAALAVLAGLAGKEVDDALAARLPEAKGKARQVLIQLAGRRRIVAAAASLLKAADDPDGQIRSAALTALGHTIQIDDLGVLIARVAKPRNPEDTPAAEAALRNACQRMPDRDQCAGKLVAAMPQAPVAVKCKLLEILSLIGGAKALEAVGAAAKDANPEIRDTASRLLGEWMGVDAAPVLLELSRAVPDAKYKIRALRGYIRLARQFDMPERQRVEMCRAALKIAERDEEKKLVLEVLDRYPGIEMLKLAVEAGKVPSLKSHTAGTALSIARKIGGDSVNVRKLLSQVGHKPVEVEIIKAEYGAGAKFKDVTGALRKQVRGFPLIVLPSPRYNDSFGGDPLPGVPKQLKIQYRIDGKEGEVSLPENAPIMLPIPK